jgi:hypothetical protein
MWKMAFWAMQKSVGASAVMILSACASASVDVFGLEQGWRRATVLQIVRADESVLVPVQTDCRVELGPQATFSHFAVVSYSWGGNPKLRAKRIVAVPVGGPPLKGAVAKINVLDCRAALALLD